MENLKEKEGLFLYHEPIKGDVYKFMITFMNNDVVHVIPNTKNGFKSYVFPNKISPDGSYFLEGVGSFFPETAEWKTKYQDSLSLRVSQGRVVVYFVSPVKRGKVNTKALVLDDNGVCFHSFVPTFPPPRFGECYIKLHMDLEVVSLIPVKDLLDKVMVARRKDSTL